MTKTPAWSYSALNLFETCPRKFQALRITKEYKEPEGEALRYGNWLHKQFEEYVRTGGQFVLPKELKHHRPLLDMVLGIPGEKFAEFQVALNRALGQVTYYAKDTWTRGKLDVLIVNGETAYVLDWKTGKPKPDHSQLKLFALYVFELFPTVTEVKAGFVWLGGDVTNPVDVNTYEREDRDALWREFLPRIKVYEDAHTNNKWPCRPSGLCKAYCVVTNCQHNGNYIP